MMKRSAIEISCLCYLLVCLELNVSWILKEFPSSKKEKREIFNTYLHLWNLERKDELMSCCLGRLLYYLYSFSIIGRLGTIQRLAKLSIGTWSACLSLVAQCSTQSEQKQVFYFRIVFKSSLEWNFSKSLNK